MKRIDTWNCAVAVGRERRMFTPEQANRSLVLVRRIVSDIVQEYSHLLDLQEMIDAAQRANSSPALAAARKDIVAVVETLRLCMQELEDIGVELKDWSLGIVDFPSIQGGREVRLCWQYGEDRVGHWYEIGDDYVVRQAMESYCGAEVVLANRNASPE